jgi:hypothetical protein
MWSSMGFVFEKSFKTQKMKLKHYFFGANCKGMLAESEKWEN